MNRAKKESFTKFKKCLFLVVFLLSLNRLSGQDTRNCMDLDYELKCNKYNALYYGRTNEITIKYDTIKYPGDFTLDFDTTYYKNVVHPDKFSWIFSIDDVLDNFGIINQTKKEYLHFNYKENDKLFKLESKMISLVDTNVWFTRLISDNFLIGPNFYDRYKLIDYLDSVNENCNYYPFIVDFVKNDHIITDLKYISYCIIGKGREEKEYTKQCLINSYAEQLYAFRVFLASWSSIYIEDIEMIDSHGIKRTFPPISFDSYYDK